MLSFIAAIFVWSALMVVCVAAIGTSIPLTCYAIEDHEWGKVLGGLLLAAGGLAGVLLLCIVAATVPALRA